MSLVIVNKISSEILTLSLNRPEKRNALNIALLEALVTALQEAKKEMSLRALIIKAEGSIFCSGLDLKEALDESTAKQSYLLLSLVFKELYETQLITIAAVQGAAIAGGAGLMSACNFALATTDAKFGYPEVKKGLVPAQVMVFLKKQLKERDLLELLLLGELIDAKKALSIGLINKLVDENQLIEEAMNIALSALKCGPKAIKKTKELVNRITGNVIKDLEMMRAEGDIIRGTPEAKEGVQAFLEGREPKYHT